MVATGVIGNSFSQIMSSSSAGNVNSKDASVKSATASIVILTVTSLMLQFGLIGKTRYVNGYVPAPKVLRMFSMLMILSLTPLISEVEPSDQKPPSSSPTIAFLRLKLVWLDKSSVKQNAVTTAGSTVPASGDSITSNITVEEVDGQIPCAGTV